MEDAKESRGAVTQGIRRSDGRSDAGQCANKMVETIEKTNEGKH